MSNGNIGGSPGGGGGGASSSTSGGTGGAGADGQVQIFYTPNVDYPLIEIYINNQWTDISSYVYYRDRITVSRGKTDEAVIADPATCSFTLNNRDGRFSPLNPTGVYYGLLGRNTPVRVSIVKNGVQYYRFCGQISNWPVEADISGNDVYVKIQAAGFTRGLKQGTPPVRSALYRDYTRGTQTNLVAYWPCEDDANANLIASGLPGGSPMAISGSPTLASYSGYSASKALPAMGTGSFYGRINTSVNTGQVSVRMFAYLPAATSGTTSLIRLYVTGTAKMWDVSIQADGDIQVRGYADDDDDNTAIFDHTYAYGVNTAGFFMIQLDLANSGTSVSATTSVLNFNAKDSVWDAVPTDASTDTVTTRSIGRPIAINVGAQGTLGQTVIGHIAVATDNSAFSDFGNANNAWNGEYPSDRFMRLCAEDGINAQIAVVFDTAFDGAVQFLGDQRPNTLFDNLSEIEQNGLGFIYEARDDLLLSYRPYLTMIDLAASGEESLTLSVADHDLADQLNPVYDDLGIHNDVTVNRADGGSYRAVDITSKLGTQDPPNGVGPYTTSLDVSSMSDLLLTDFAHTELHKGTIDEARYPQIQLQLASSEISGDSTLLANCLSLEIGDVIRLTDLPSYLPPDDVYVTVLGYEETFDKFAHEMTINCVSEKPYETVLIDIDHYDTAGSSLSSSANSSTTSLSVATTSGPIWTTTAGDFPFDIMVGGERMTVSTISGSSSPQTFTVTRSVNGVTKSHASGEDVRLFKPAYRAI